MHPTHPERPLAPMRRVTSPFKAPPASHPASTLYTPKINGNDTGKLGYQELLGTLDRLVYVSCRADIIVPPATARLYWGVDEAGLPRQIDSIVIVEETDTVTFAVPGAKIAGTLDPIGQDYTGDGTHAVFVRMDYGASYDESPPASATVKCSEPGGPDPIGATRDINENLAKPTITPSPIPDADTPVWIVVEGYDVRYIGDRMTFEWGGPRNAFHLDVTSDTGALTIQVPPEIIARVGGGKIPVSYFITDIVGNWSKYAPYAEPDVDIDPGTLLRPQLLYADGTAVEGVLDLAKVAGDHVILRVPVRNLVEGDIVNAWWEATLANGETERYTSGDLVFDDEDNQFVLDVRIEHALAVQAAGGTVRIWYVRQGDGALSKQRVYRVSELPEVNLPAPVVPLADGDELDPFDKGNDIEVQAPFAPEYMFVGTQLTMIMQGVSGSVNRYWTETLTLSSADLGQPVPFFCPAGDLQAVLNGTARFHYEISQPSEPLLNATWRPSATAIGSDELVLNIRHAGALPNYPPPIMADVVDGALASDLSQTHVVVPLAAAGGPAPATQVTLSWSAPTPYSSEGKVPASGPLDFRVLGSAYIKPNDGENVTVTYRDTAGRASDPLVFRVGAALTLPAPTVDEAAAGTLDPFAAANGATVRVPATLKAGDQVVVHFGTWNSVSTPWTPTMAVLVPPAEVARRLGQTVDVSYTVNGADTSPTLTLNILNFGDGDPRLPRPAIDKATGDTLDLGSFTGNPNATVAKWPLIAVGQTVWLKITGVLANGNPTTITLLNGVPATAGMVTNGLKEAIKRADLQVLRDGSTLTVECKVNFSGGSEAGAVTFLPGSYRLKHATPEFILDRSDMHLLVGSNDTRTPTGGTLPYSYASSNTGIATVNGTGTVTARSVGSTTITVRDSSNPQNSGSYTVTVKALPVTSEDFETAPLGPIGGQSNPLDRPGLIIWGASSGSLGQSYSIATSQRGQVITGKAARLAGAENSSTGLDFEPKTPCKKVRLGVYFQCSPAPFAAYVYFSYSGGGSGTIPLGTNVLSWFEHEAPSGKTIRRVGVYMNSNQPTQHQVTMEVDNITMTY